MTESDISTKLPELAALRGSQIGVSDWKLIDQAMIDQFSALTGDAGPIHNDPREAALIAPFGGTIVQGFMMLSHLTGFAKSLDLPQNGVIFRLNYGFDKVRILAPVPANSRIRGSFTLRDLVARDPNAAVMTIDAEVELEGSTTPAVVAEWLGYLHLTGES